ncbi:putative FadE36, aminoglycoside phosphotransferase [Paraburkholderia ribeironis]|uniref:Putative FadE36, aminoglycoside phosphotransferase n=1 Tax=Paraburkholderia ribeironis TaxID=1247936 RepID=A0A1N7RMY7_9BURK|nr:phosphotransferase family protein [Paraburkholderia ribeironis]SIT36472.1 putative FadE36, aminoglycoside phosphotransferase [Paraburkholderia ribeironis]
MSKLENTKNAVSGLLHESTVPSRESIGIEGLADDGALARVGKWLALHDISDSRVARASRLSGGAIQENWRLEMTDGSSLVLRTDADAAIPTSCTREEEFYRYRLAFENGARVARPEGFCNDPRVIGKPFFILEFVSGITAGHLLAKNDEYVPNREALSFELGVLLGTVHRTPANHARAVFGEPPRFPASASIDHIRKQLDDQPEPHPALELCLRELEVRLGGVTEAVFCHGDYRTGNYMVDEGRVTAILDWEFSGWGHPNEDLGWFTAPCWRFGRNEMGGGGVGPLQNFLDGYHEATRRRVEPAELLDWQALAQVKWAVIALHQEQRHVSGAQRSLELALSGRLVSALALEALNLLEIR